MGKEGQERMLDFSCIFFSLLKASLCELETGETWSVWSGSTCMCTWGGVGWPCVHMSAGEYGRRWWSEELRGGLVWKEEEVGSDLSLWSGISICVLDLVHVCGCSCVPACCHHSHSAFFLNSPLQSLRVCFTTGFAVQWEGKYIFPFAKMCLHSSKMQMTIPPYVCTACKCLHVCGLTTPVLHY